MTSSTTSRCAARTAPCCWEARGCGSAGCAGESAGVRKAERLRLPGGREVVLGWGEVGREDSSTLSPLERAGLALCRTDKRRREFVAGRLAAHRALALL